MQPGYFQGNPPPYQRPGSSAPPNNFQQGPPPPPPPPPPWPGGPQAGTPQNFGIPYQYPPAHTPSHYPQQPWSGPPPSAPPASHVSTTNYNPNSYGPMPNSLQSPVSPIRQSQNIGALGSGPFNPGPGYPQPTHHVPNQQYGPGGPPHGPQQSNPTQPYGTQGPSFHTPAHMQQPYPPPQQNKPPLPPRPSSAIQHHQSQSYPMAGQSPHPPQQPGFSQGSQQNRQSYLASALGQGRGDHYNQANPYTYNVEQPQIPPLPPPLPQGYQIEVLQNQQGQPQHPPYSHQPPTHRYEPPVQNSLVSMPFDGQAQGLDQVQGGYGTVGHIPTSQMPGAPDFQPLAPSLKPASDINQSHMQHALNSTPAGAVGGTPGLNTSQPYFTSSSHTEQPVSDYHQTSSNAPAGVVSPPSSESGVAWAQQQQVQSAPPQTLQQFEEHRQDGHGDIQQTLHLERPPSTIQKTPFQPSSDQNQQNLDPISNQSSQPGLTGQHSQYEQQQQHVRSEHGQQSLTAQSPSPGRASEPGHGHDGRNNPIAQEVQTAPTWDQRYPPNMPSETAPNPEYHPTPPSTGHSQQPSGSSFYASHDMVASNQAKVPLESQRPDSLRLQNPASTATIDAGSIKPSTHKEVSQEEEGISQKQKPASDHSGVSALGTGGPSDWEHFGVSEVDEIDDTAMFAGKKPDALITPINDFAELSSQPSPTAAVKQHSQSSQISNPSEMWPTPPPLAPLKLHGQTADSPPNTANQHEQNRFIPTPPLGTHHHFGSQDQDTGKVTTEHDRHESIDEALQTWALPDKPVGNVDQTRSQFSGMPNLPDQSSINAVSWPEESKEQKTAVGLQPQKTSGIPHHNKNQLEHDRNHTQSPPTHSFVIDDGSWSRETAKQRIETSSPALMSEATSAQLCVPPPQSQQPGSRLSHTSTQTDAPDTDGRLQEAPNHQATIATSPESNPLPARKDHLPQSFKRPQDPYDHLEPWYKESLGRYATMLESESQAATDQERTKIFTDFMMAESRLRGVRYGSAIGNWGTTRSEPSDFTKKQPTLNQTQETGGTFSSTNPQVERVPSPMSSAESYVVVDSLDDGDFSPGGRPRLTRVAPETAMHPSAKPNVNSNSRQRPALASPVHEQGPVSTPRSRSDDQIPHSSIISQAPSTTAERPFSPPSTNSVAPASDPVPEEPAYKPFRYNTEPSHRLNASERKVNKSPQPTDVESTRLDYKAYSPNRNSSADKATASQPVPATAHPTQYMGIAKGTRAQAGPTKGEHTKAPANEEIGLQALRGSPPLANQARRLLSEPQKHAQSYMEDSVSNSARECGLTLELRSILPSNRGQAEMSTTRLDPVVQASQSIADDFQFIEDLTKSWNMKAKKLRDKNEHERRIRQEEQDEHTSRLFDEEAIGYGDLGVLDDEFKQSETEKKAQEDRSEYQDFVENVFDPVYNRLQEQIQQLMEQYIYCADLMKEAVTGEKALEPHGDRPVLTLVVDAFLDLHRKIELRHRKVSEALLNRDRRFGKTEVQLLYHVGNVTKMKQMERHFADAEKKAILDAANKCDERAKGLLDIVEENTIKAVEINQDYMDEIMQTIRKSEGLAPPITGSTRDSDDLQRELSFAQGVLRSLTTTSERFMEQFYEASGILNTADHDALIAKSRLADADTATLTRLNEEQKMEETRLKQELDHRLAIVRDDSKKANEYIESLLSQLKRSDGSSSPKGSREESAAPDPEHQERIKKALEAAKRRNTAKSPDVYAAPE